MNTVAVRISSCSAPLVDVAAVRRLLIEIPEAEQIASQLATPFFTRFWQPSSMRSFWIQSDGTSVLCLTLSGLDIDESVALWVSFDVYYLRAGSLLSGKMLRDVIEAELGLSVELDGS